MFWPTLSKALAKSRWMGSAMLPSSRFVRIESSYLSNWLTVDLPLFEVIDNGFSWNSFKDFG